MKFGIERTIGHVHKDRFKICTKEEKYFKNLEHLRDVKYMLVTLIKTTEDFNLEANFNIVNSTDSLQYRPKAIFENKKGFFFYKSTDKKTKYLSKEE